MSRGETTFVRRPILNWDLGSIGPTFTYSFKIAVFFEKNVELTIPRG